jgi:hypothetical protein
LSLYKNQQGYRPLAHAPFRWQPGRAYDLHLQVEGARLRGWVKGGPELSWEDADAPFLHGQIGLANFPGSHTRFHYLELA